ncbi:hypothetical protein B0H12DRAFT_1129395 [Mycena haematopus]|nr:hypothetical protein B0H12DRAFT_1129395 [Mycena haematopus]
MTADSAMATEWGAFGNSVVVTGWSLRANMLRAFKDTGRRYYNSLPFGVSTYVPEMTSIGNF